MGGIRAGDGAVDDARLASSGGNGAGGWIAPQQSARYRGESRDVGDRVRKEVSARVFGGGRLGSGAGGGA